MSEAFDVMRAQAIIRLRLLLPGAEDPSRLVDECLTSARRSFRDDFILSLSPEAWARISLIYCKNFLDTGCDISVGEIVAKVLRDSIHIGRMDMLTQQLATEKEAQAQHDPRPAPALKRVK